MTKAFSIRKSWRRNAWPAQVLGMLMLWPLAGCDSGGEPEDTDPKSGNTEDIELLEEPADALSKKIEALTGGHTRLVWSFYNNPDPEKNDVYANFSSHQLHGIDTRDGKGVRVILEENSNYSRPLITPDGQQILYTNKNTERDGEKKTFSPVIYLTDWAGSEPKELGTGLAVDVWRNPVTREDWVYVADLTPTDKSSMFAAKLERFSLARPDKREIVWDRTKISVDNIQLSRDGKRASCLFPWPSVGVIDLETNKWRQHEQGCWPSMAPDDSYVSWVFSGSHREAYFFNDDGTQNWTVKFSEAPGIGDHEVYHPRWSNHPRFMAMTGPYTAPTIGKGGAEAEIYIGKFSSDLRKMDKWLKITENTQSDLFPDMWVAEGKKESLDAAQFASTKVSDTGETAESWPANTTGLVFLWEDARQTNAVTEKGQAVQCSVEPKGFARYDRHRAMLLDQGHFTADTASSTRVNHTDGIELLITPANVEQKGSIISHPHFQLWQHADSLLFARYEGEATSFVVGKVKAGETAHVVISHNADDWVAYMNGLPTTRGVQLDPPAAHHGLTFGTGWAGTIQGVALYNRALSVIEVEQNYQYWMDRLAKREPLPKLRVRAKLIEAAPTPKPTELDTYTSALVGNVYEVEKVLEGVLPDSEIQVWHWAILDLNVLKNVPSEIGKSYELTLEPESAHPELNNPLKFWFPNNFAPLFFDVSSPE